MFCQNHFQHLLEYKLVFDVMRKIIHFILPGFFFFFLLLLLTSCAKQNDWLNAKREKSDVVPSNLSDFQALLDNTILMNSGYPGIGLAGSDNFYIPDDAFLSINEVNKNLYVWNKEIYVEPNPRDYTAGYGIIANANSVIDGLQQLNPNDNAAEYNHINGQALYYRAVIFYEMAGLFCKPYIKSTAANDLGICLRRTSNVFHIEPRSSIQQTYEQIVQDLLRAIPALPVTPIYRTRPSKPAAFAMLARTYLLMEDYGQAERYADSTLSYFDELLDFNGGEITLSKPFRFPDFAQGNREVIFYATSIGYAGTTPSEIFNVAFVDSNLYRSYEPDDLRKVYFYDLVEQDKARFRGTYTGNDRNFSGIACNEVYFIRAESNARLGEIENAVEDLNKVLRKRFKQGTYTDFASSDASIVLRKVLEERRKEFPFTGQIRWQDLRRLNSDPRFAKTLVRKLHGVTYQLNPNDRKYVYPLPPTEVNKGGIVQNER